MASLFGRLRPRGNRKTKVNKDSRMLTRERIKGKLEKDDFLLAQIDEFREKAKQLQEILASKETKAQELQTIVEERTTKADELQQILEERQAKADGITVEVSRQIDVLIDQVNAKMQEIEESMNGKIEDVSNSVNGDIQSIEQSFAGSLEETRRANEEQTAQMRAVLQQANAQMLETLEGLNEQLVSLKADLSDKIHTENVKSYRNIQDLFKEFDGKQADRADALTGRLKSIKGLAVAGLIFSIINLAGLTVFILNTIGIIRIF